MKLQRNRLSIAVMGIILGNLPLVIFAETQTTDEIINLSGSGGADIELNNTGSSPNSTADWEICTGGNATSTTCNGVTGSLPIMNGFHITNKAINSIGIESGAGSPTIPLLYLDSFERVGINTASPVEELHIESTLPGIRLKDTSAGAGHADIHVSTNLMAIENTTGNDVIGVELNGGAAQNSQLWLDSTGNVAVGKSNPTSGADFEVGGEGNILLENGVEDWVIWTSSSELILRNGDNAISGISFPFRIENQTPNTNFIMKNNGNIGMGGVYDPEAALHLRRENGTAQLLVEETSGAVAVRSLIQMKNNGPVGFLMEDTEQSVEWEFRSNSTGNFIFNDVGDSSEMTLLKNGNLNVKGNIVANGIALTSSRASKADFSPVKANEVMQKLAKIEVEEWRYKEADKGDRHISPMAEDFYSLFKLGPDNKHINPNDLASVAIIAAKELQKKTDLLNAKTEQLESKTVALKAENKALQKRLASLEKLVTNLASATDHLSTQGSKVAFK